MSTTKTRQRSYLARDWEAAAFASGVKTMLSVPVDPQPPIHCEGPAVPSNRVADAWNFSGNDGRASVRNIPMEPPFRVGDVLAVKECWSPDHAAFYPNFPCVYRCETDLEINKGRVFSPEQNHSYPFQWRPSFSMPHHHIRTFRRVSKVECKRLGELTPDQYAAHGVGRLEQAPGPLLSSEGPFGPQYGHPMTSTHEASMFAKWDERYGKRFPSASSPWIWLLTLENLR